MTHTVRLHTCIPINRKVEITLPADVPDGDADLVVSVTPRQTARGRTGLDLLNSEIVGIWADRKDIDDSAAFARDLRERAWRRGQE